MGELYGINCISIKLFQNFKMLEKKKLLIIIESAVIYHHVPYVCTQRHAQTQTHSISPLYLGNVIQDPCWTPGIRQHQIP